MSIFPTALLVGKIDMPTNAPPERPAPGRDTGRLIPARSTESDSMAPTDHDNDHGERIAVLETKIETIKLGHSERLKAIEDKIWWAMVAVVGTAGSVLWQLVPSFIKGLGGK